MKPCGCTQRMHCGYCLTGQEWEDYNRDLLLEHERAIAREGSTVVTKTRRGEFMASVDTQIFRNHKNWAMGKAYWPFPDSLETPEERE